MTHCVHGVVALVAVECPVTFFVREELDLAHLAHGHVGGHFIETGALGCRTTIRAGDQKLVTVQVHRVVGHGEVADANTHLVVEPDVQGVDARKDTAVPCPQIEVRHLCNLGGRSARLDVVGAQQEAEVSLHHVDQGMLVLRVRDPEAHHAHGHLHHLVRMRVVHEGAWPACDELVDEGLARLDCGLVQSRHTVHAIGQTLSMPVDAGVLGQLVGHKNANAIAFHHFDGGPGTLAVVAPQMGLEARRHLAHHRLGDQVKLLDALIHPPRQCPAVKCDHRVVGPPRVGHQRRHGVRAGLDHRLGQCRHGHAAHRAGRDRSACDARIFEKISSGCHDMNLCFSGPHRPHWARWT